MSTLAEFYLSVQKSCLPGVWSKGIGLARDGAVQLDLFSGTEIILRVKSSEKAVAAKVSLWPEDEDSFCDCGDRSVPCAHIAAAIAALKTGLKKTDDSLVSTPNQKTIRYCFRRNGKFLLFERWLGELKLPISEPLVGLVGGINSGRIASPPGTSISATQDDFAIDQALSERINWTRLFKALHSIPGIELDSKPIRIGGTLHGVSAEVRDDGAGFRIIRREENSIEEIFENGIVLSDGFLKILTDPGLTSSERQMLSPPGRWFAPSEIPLLISEIIPSLEKKIAVRILAKNLPHIDSEISEAPPRIVLNLTKTAEHTLSVNPSIEYPSPYSIKDPVAERNLLRKLQGDLQLAPGHRVEFSGMAAIQFNQLAERYLLGSSQIELIGNGREHFKLENDLVSDFQVESLSLSFKSPSGKLADPAAVFKSWKLGESHVPLLGGGYSPLPLDWLERFGKQIQRLLLMRESNGTLPSYLRPAVIELANELGSEIPNPLIEFKRQLDQFEKLPVATLPRDLNVELRHYQVQGINWLSFLRDSKMGALLADDMGLGKTLQALCAIRGRTLVVTPTSVLHSWKDQIQKFRPSLKTGLFYGSKRKLNPDSDITLTSYGLLRQDLEALLAVNWETIILDEAQMIKNPESQVTQAAHQLAFRSKSAFKITLSGTPVENSMEDLWSQFQFLNPQMLGTRREFQEEFATPISRGNEQATQRLRKQIRPFILRRLKKEVATELPPRTEVVLNCQLSSEEQNIYDGLLAAGRKEVIEKLDEGGSVFGALELLLRLRQACCHPNLVPGQKAETSSKLELLAETLESTIAEGHRALIFSQWTSFLDLIGPRLDSMGVKYSRLDGSTHNRQDVVAEFQDPNGPPVMLISLKAGGVGLTLTAADHVFLMDSWWNPAVEDQAADRVHRIGQENPVLICRMITENTLEEKILELQKRKLELSRSVLEGSGKAVSLTREDILGLLS